MRTYTVRYTAEDGSDAEQHTRQHVATATRLYQRLLHRHKTGHISLTESGHLPGAPERVIAEVFGDRTRGEQP